ncbi:MAG TPA: hypothetical protein VGU44_02925, partial [Gammaproteobacteria bacterium]|nr:hypothetical protein [Gammaproteobacteria bacterium]
MFHSSICLHSSLVDVKLKLGDKHKHKHKLKSESSGYKSLEKPAKKPKKPSNPYGRMREPEGGVAAVVVTKKNGALIFSQYQTPSLLDNPELFRTLVIEEDTSTSTSPTKTPFGDLRLKVYTPEGKTIHNCRRFYDMVNNGEASAVLFFSPAKDKMGEDREVQIVRHETNLKPMALFAAVDELNHEMPF